ncbi:hypothetical protein, partial [Streptomyces sp. YGL11-2]|uniref:hypothetical protein n=1 Tax=Streptomyces sp. YGL11-2 TaxID=3414028 RepID=UPI003CFB1FA3
PGSCRSEPAEQTVKKPAEEAEVVLLAPLAELTSMVALTVMAPLTALTALVAEATEAEKVAVLVAPVVAEVTAVVPTVVITAHRDGLAPRGSLDHTGGGDDGGRGKRHGGDGTPYELTHAFLLFGRK